jgi:hypothetical protein
LSSSEQICSGKKYGRHVDEQLHESDNALHKFNLLFLNNVYRCTKCSVCFDRVWCCHFYRVAGSEFLFEFNVIVLLTKRFCKIFLPLPASPGPFFPEIQSGLAFPHPENLRTY